MFGRHFFRYALCTADVPGAGAFYDAVLGRRLLTIAGDKWTTYRHMAKTA